MVRLEVRSRAHPHSAPPFALDVHWEFPFWAS